MWLKTRVVSNPQILKALTPLRWEILRLLAEKERYTAELIQLLETSEQNIYYNVNKLLELDLIELAGIKEVRGGKAKLYRCAVDSLFLPINKLKESNMAEKEPPSPALSLISLDSTPASFFQNILGPQVKKTFRLVVGSPDAHGPYRASARDGHYAIQLALLLGQLSVASYSQDFASLVALDVEMTNDENLQRPLIVVGGPVTNLVAERINAYLPIKFSETKPFGLISKKAEIMVYVNDTVGIISKIPNPWAREYDLILLAGLKREGTWSAVLALTKFWKRILADIEDCSFFSCVVEGIDVAGDGIIDDITILERTCES
ncbi:MAG: helix-turn-helix domain-containing protein [Promethearchaeota archaeon]